MNSQNFLLMPLRLAINNVKCAGKYPTSNEIRQISLSAHMNQWSVINSKRLHKDVKIDHKYSSTTKNCLQNSNFLGNCHNLLSCNTRLLTQCRHNSSYIPDFLKGWSVSAASSVSSNAPTNIPEPPPSLGAGPVAGTGAGPVDGIEYIPVPPPPLDAVIEPAVLNSLGEATLTSLGLGGWGPVGLMQQFIELIHVHCGLPWWGAIAAVTVAFRLLMSPLVLMAQRNAAQLHNVSPQMQVLQMKITEARESGDQLQVSRYTNELMVFMKEKNVNPLKSMIVPIAQAPIFISMFVGLRRCAALPVASFTTGGLWWFSDLTVADPYYILPILTSITMYATIKIGTEVGRVQASGDSSRIMFAVLEFMPLAMLPFMIKFPAAVLCYWMSSNLVSLGQAGLLRVPAVRNFCKIPQMNKYNSNSLPMTEKQKKKTVVEAVKDSWKNLKVTREVQDRLRYDEIRFEKAGTGPVVRTFKYDPTKTSKKSGPVKAPIKVKASIKH
ncbi:mitochondrial inner membrane protein OXA1L isoform X3 [Hyalella azteca]|uniref:Mitochondrial inner membrane protein OXA1L isoform X3 n=1 Tax=Hyalella azteca TaxID=294128 RepID=A0A8B7NW60_HYAAZ|nr:mitochondrial inner membrane protein OXA1L isoform X3 [Hyalella azteca]